MHNIWGKLGNQEIGASLAVYQGRNMYITQMVWADVGKHLNKYKHLTEGPFPRVQPIPLYPPERRIPNGFTSEEQERWEKAYLINTPGEIYGTFEKRSNACDDDEIYGIWDSDGEDIYI